MALTVQGLTKAYGNQRALWNVSFELEAGVAAVLGPNGAGKSTLLRILATLVRPDSGAIAFAGHPYRQSLRALRATLGYLPADLELPDGMTPRGFLHHLAVLKMLPNPAASITASLHALDLEPIADIPLNNLSGGQVRLAGVAQAFLGTPRLVVLDEPTRGLDIQERERVFRMMRQAMLGRMIIFSTHLPDEAALVANQLVVLSKGAVMFVGKPEELVEATHDVPSNGILRLEPWSLEEAYLRLIEARNGHANK